MTNFKYSHVIVRDLASSLENCLHLEAPESPINFGVAKIQHDAYVNTLRDLIPVVVELEADEEHPDCCFVEDTVIVVNDIAVIATLGATERRGEEEAVEAVLSRIDGITIKHLTSPATFDGGDVLFTGREILVGLSRRTNEHAVQQLSAIFASKGITVIGIPVTAGLHLKSVVSAFDWDTLVVSSCQMGQTIENEISSRVPGRFEFCRVPDSIAANVVRIDKTLLVQEAYPASLEILSELCASRNVYMAKLNMSELMKADGALTCCSVLFSACC